MTSLEDLLEELKQDYLATFPAKIELIERLMSEEAFDLLETEYHKMKGTGRTHGLPEVTQVGELLERLCEVDRPSLPIAVPLSIDLLKSIQKARSHDRVFDLEAVPEFLVLVRLVMTAGQTPLPITRPPRRGP